MFYDRDMERQPALAADSGLHRALQAPRVLAVLSAAVLALEWVACPGSRRCCAGRPPREAMRYPGEFVPAAEESGLIVDIGGWVLEAACAQLAEWRAAGIAPPRLALNVSAFAAAPD